MMSSGIATGKTSVTTLVREDYNKRLFSGNWRSRIHLSRFHWVAKQLRRLGLNHLTIIELGCYDGKTIEFLDCLPEAYLGLDANWEGGLDAGRVKWKHWPNIELRLCRNPLDIPTPQSPYTVGICMETLEHVPPDIVEPYLQKLSGVIKGHIFITVPVERGLAFLIKHGLKRLLGMKDNSFRKGEFFNSVIGKLDRVMRHEHKGFDDRVLVRQIEKHFDIISVSGVFPGLPIIGLNLTIGIVARTRTSQV